MQKGDTRCFLVMKPTPPKGWEKGPVCNFCNNRPLFLRFSKFVVVDHVCSPLGSDICIWIMPHSYYTNLLSGHFVVFGFQYLRNLLFCRKFGPSLEAKTDKWAVIIKKLLRFKTPDLLIIDFLLLHPEWTIIFTQTFGIMKETLFFRKYVIPKKFQGWSLAECV